MRNTAVIFVYVMILMTGCTAQKSALSKFVPQDYVVFKKHTADLNRDGQEDCILIVKGTNEAHVVINRFYKKVDRNRRGIIILFKKNKGYQLITENLSCFSSENEDGGIYYQPQLSIKAENEDLIIDYNHGRYGSLSYRFRLLNNDFNLIEYASSSNYGPVTNNETNINFLSKVKLVRENINEDAEGNDEVFKDTSSSIKIDRLIRLSDIKNFNELDLSMY